MSNKVVICGVDTSTLPKLTEEQSMELLREAVNGNKRARDEFIVANMRLVLSIIKRFGAKKKCADDVFQAGMIGLIKSVDNFDLSVGVKFSTYAVPMIIGEIKRHLRDVNSLRVPRSIRDTAYLALKTRTELEKDDDEVSIEDIAKKMNVAVKEVAYSLDAISDTVSLYDPVYNKNGDEFFLCFYKPHFRKVFLHPPSFPPVKRPHIRQILLPIKYVRHLLFFHQNLR